MSALPGYGIMGFPMPGGTPPFVPKPQGGFMDRIGGLLGGGQSYGGLLSPEDEKAARQRQMLAMGASLLQAGGPSPTKIGLGQALGGSMMAGMQARDQSEQGTLQALLLKSQIEKAKQKDKGKLVPVVGPDGKPTLKYEADAEGGTPYEKAGGAYGQYQPGDYTPESWAEFVRSNDPAVLKRYITPRQEYSPSFQNVEQTLPDGSTQRGTFDTRTGAYNWSSPIVPPGTKARVDAAGREEGAITGARTGKAQTAYNVFQVGMKGLQDAMEQTVTGPFMGRIPAVTGAQQTAEGAEATMAPVLKQLFRDSGEGTFTDSDQEMLMKMVPTRKDHPEARAAKIQMIDGIVRAKLGIDGTASASPVGVGQTTTVNGVKVTRKK